ncbi:MAG: hypothetical protein LBV67_11090, partial [Streptococcaceae bacterium]|nr:hypothetical protein [Streptococcaceae bacterium]
MKRFKLAQKGLTLASTAILGFSTLPMSVHAITSAPQNENDFVIYNPYENVNWETFGQYRAALHTHTTISDGSATVAETVFDHYNK